MSKPKVPFKFYRYTIYYERYDSKDNDNESILRRTVEEAKRDLDPEEILTRRAVIKDRKMPNKIISSFIRGQWKDGIRNG